MLASPCPTSSRSRLARGPVVQLVGGDRAEQRLDAGHGGNGDAADEHGAPGARRDGHAANWKPLAKPPWRSMRSTSRPSSTDAPVAVGDRDERRRDDRQRTRHPLPREQHARWSPGRGTRRARAGPPVVPAAPSRFLSAWLSGAPPRMMCSCASGDGDADAGQHAVHDGGRDGQTHARDPRQRRGRPG